MRDSPDSTVAGPVPAAGKQEASVFPQTFTIGDFSEMKFNMQAFGNLSSPIRQDS